MPVRRADARWDGTLQEGKGTMRFGTFEGAYSFGSRFEEAGGTNPEEMVGAAHAGCYSMALAGALGRADHPPTSISTRAEVHLNKTDAGFRVQRIDLFTEASVPGISEDQFQEIAENTKSSCPISVLLSSAEINLEAKLV